MCERSGLRIGPSLEESGSNTEQFRSTRFAIVEITNEQILQ